MIWMVNNTAYQFVGSNLGVKIFFKKKEHQKKGTLKWKIEAALYTLYWCSKNIPFTLYTHVLSKILQNGAKLIQKLIPSFKIHMRNWATLDKQWKVQKVKTWWATFVQKIHLSKKYIPSAKTLYTEDLSIITFNYLCENSPNCLYHFWNHKLFFTTQLLCTLLTQTLYTFHKSSPSKCTFSDFPVLALKFTKCLMSFFKQKASFSSKFRSFFNVMRDDSFVLF